MSLAIVRSAFSLVLVFVIGSGVSFMGAISVGTLNLGALQISLVNGPKAGMLFSLGAITAEMGFVLLSLLGVEWIQRQKAVFRFIEWSTVLLIILLAVGSVYAATHPQAKPTGNIFLPTNLSPFVVGMSMRLLFPTMIPFWLGWNTILFSRNILLPKASYYLVYVPSTGVGTFLAHLVYIKGGDLATTTYQKYQVPINWVIGGIFFVTAVAQIALLRRRRFAVVVQP
jgi:threonine/homoserine/homoserine lactone efflux protein